MWAYGRVAVVDCEFLLQDRKWKLTSAQGLDDALYCALYLLVLIALLPVMAIVDDYVDTIHRNCSICSMWTENARPFHACHCLYAVMLLYNQHRLHMDKNMRQWSQTQLVTRCRLFGMLTNCLSQSAIYSNKALWLCETSGGRPASRSLTNEWRGIRPGCVHKCFVGQFVPLLNSLVQSLCPDSL